VHALYKPLNSAKFLVFLKIKGTTLCFQFSFSTRHWITYFFEISHGQQIVEMHFHSTKALALRFQNTKYKAIVKKSFNDTHQN
jgi:hypothetical protein